MKWGFLENNQVLKNLKNDIQSLVRQGVIDEKTAQRIKNHYDNQKTDSGNRILMVFGVLAACLIGLGVILIIGHNWDKLNNGLKTAIAFLPLLLSQGLCFFAVRHKKDSPVWREACAILLFFGVGACMAMVSQIYHLQGEISSFLLTWMLLSLPIFYLLPSRVVAMFYFIGISQAVPIMDKANAFWSIGAFPWAYFMMFGLGFPYYLHNIKKLPNSNFSLFLNWTVALSALFMVVKNEFHYVESISLTLIMMMAIYYGIGRLSFFKDHKLRTNSFLIIGSVGTVLILFLASFGEIWNRTSLDIDLVKMGSLGLVALGLLVWNLVKKNIPINSILPFAFIIYFFTFADLNSIGPITVNLLLLGIGLEYLYRGHQSGRLTYYNYGLGIIAITIIARFLEWDLSFVIRGICFVILGLLFFIANFFLVKRKNKGGGTD